MEEKKTCCFFGHRKISGTNELKERLYEIIEELILCHHADAFLFGSKSEFDKLCLAVVTELKEKYPYIQRIYVRAEFPYINDDYKAYLLKSYDDTYYPKQIFGSGRAVYIERNYMMIDHSDICVVYYNKHYQPPTRKNSSRKSGTKIAYEYAQKKKKVVIQTADF